MPQHDNMKPLLLTGPEAAQLCGVKPRTWWRWTHSGRAPRPIKFADARPGSVRYRRSELEEWVAAGCPRCDE